MRELRLIFVLAFFVLSFSIIGKAQQVPNYVFLEVIDSSGKPVADANVETPPGSLQIRQTSQDGQVSFPFPYVSEILPIRFLQF